MDKNSIIKELYWNNVEISEPFHPDTPEYEEAVKRREEAEERLMKILPEGGIKIFEDFMEAYADIEILEEEEIYRQGFCFGMQITAEAYMGNKNKVVSYGDE